VFVDFDGTLAEIVDKPSAARPHARAVDVLRSLADRWGVVAVVSGRPASYLLEQLGGAGRTRLLGLYGLEAATADGGVATRPEGEQWRSAAQTTAEEAAGAVPEGVVVEPKGLTVTIHYRAVPERAGEIEALAGRLASAHGLTPHGGKMSVELRPPVAVDKGTVVEELAEGLTAVAFAGDDIGDLPAFAALERLAHAGVVTLGLASAGAETPGDVLAAADVVADGPSGVLSMLAEMALG
jgi:trehalose 6-phosphate phosphatase